MSQQNGVFLDWMRLSYPGMLDKHFMHVDTLVGMHCGLGDRRRLLGYDGSVMMALGFFGGRVTSMSAPYEHDDGEMEEDWFFDALMEIPGELCAQMGRWRLIELCQLMEQEGFYATRIDMAYDLRDERVNVKMIEDMFKRKQVVTRSDQRNGITGTAKMGEACSLLQGGTLRVGGRQSELYMKIYDKREEHFKKTGIDIGHCTRFELEIKGEKAKSAFQALCRDNVDKETGEILDLNLASFLKDFICFYKTPKQKEVCDWWAAIEDAPELVWPQYEHHASLDATLHWLRTQVMPTMKALHAFGYHGQLYEMLQHAKPSRELSKYLENMKKTELTHTL
jgi:hypothetical protein